MLDAMSEHRAVSKRDRDVRFMLYLSALSCSNVVLLVCQGERGPVGPAAVGPRGVPGIPGERGEQVSVTQSLLLFS